MKKLLALEELAQLVLALYVFFHLPQHLSMYWLLPVFFFPDLFALGYLVNSRVGASLYNFSHHKFIALLCFSAGFFLNSPAWLQIGCILYAHSCFDRTLGYGLKFSDNPNRTHLGFTGKQKDQNPPDSF